MKAAIVGSSGMAEIVASMLERINGHRRRKKAVYELIGFFDDTKAAGTPVLDYGTVLGGLDVLNSWQEPLAVFMAVGYPKARKRIAETVTNPLMTFPDLFDPDAVVEVPRHFRSGGGNIVCGGVRLRVGVTLGRFNLLLPYTVVGHDTTLGDFNSLMPRTTISGNVKIENVCLFGGNSFVREKLHVADGVKVAPCTPLMSEVASGTTVRVVSAPGA